MYSIRKSRQQLAFAIDANIVNEEEFLLLWDANASKNPDYPVTVYPKFNLDDKDVAEVKTEFRFEKIDIPSLYEVLRIPKVFRCKQGSVCDGMTGLCIMLKRLTYPCRYSDMIPSFGISVPELCMIYNTVVDYIFNRSLESYIAKFGKSSTIRRFNCCQRSCIAELFWLCGWHCSSYLPSQTQPESGIQWPQKSA